ncbi:hypothetical protein [Nocardia vulneris]|uniref:Head-to-tail stopper n=1 Tax=Nocardia vulneris TaxID=1141657 RepID=A0ABR4ZDB9_9NOCA|nr:hypothetical protein [Nocardia vulneris]KIA63004.1 hypothetical protein FG87_21765 [Nocardia vulneris]
MTIPLPFTIGHRAYSGSGEDAHGNEIGSHAAAVDIQAFYYSPSSTEPAVAGHDRVVVDMVAVVDSDEQIGPHDLLVIDGEEFDVIGFPEDYDHGPWWKPGRKPVNLQRVDG